MSYSLSLTDISDTDVFHGQTEVAAQIRTVG
ncbi:hypothetical protein X979_577 [Burkholderia pseudomallei MSHR7527]|nr:hypothetical protein DO66_3551 [Burkholderia pseudomallei]KGS44285.1 hypothetical protein X992_3894 [Burkholderia pseudomallei MSHR5492]KGS62178.1 hypothetical protein X979_577 [Burkholderia pseudomallei MSHR7527]KGX01064.1 hypothetical protein Y601_1174 [Burkholderia pseudomallei MSHR640]KGX75854.1 hypothetical protein Y033_1790 [Burkholderia pseudomallei MSHR435]KGX99388.1 hypothetical protein X997_4045 [Burkholderia pseudomallei A79C]